MRPLRPRHPARCLRSGAARHAPSIAVRCARARDFYIRKDFDPKLGLTVVIVGAAISAVFYWFEPDLIAYSILGGAALIDLVVYGRLKDLTVCYRCHTEFRGAYPRTAPAFDLHTADVLEQEYERQNRPTIADARHGSVISSRFGLNATSEERDLHHRALLPPCSDRRESRCSRRPATGW